MQRDSTTEEECGDVFDMQQTLEALASERKLFHSEADFQHALAMKIAQLYPSAAIRLEVPIEIEGSRIHLDIRVSLEDQIIAIELKYATAKLSLILDHEFFDLRDQSADDNLRYGFCYDIERLEKAIGLKHCTEGFAVILSNYNPFWKHWTPSLSKKVNDEDFRIHEGRRLHGELKWGPKTKPKYVKKPLKLKGQYELRWNDYSHVEDVKNGLFRYAAVQILPTWSSETEV